jgi:tetratricopeptide (TPR) repeat protein
LKTLCKLYSDQGEEGRDSATVICSAYEEVAGENLTADEMLRIGTIYVTLGNTEKAVPLLTKAVERDSSLEAAAKFQLGTLYFKAQNYAAAVPYFEQAVAADPQFVPALLNLGLAKMQLKEQSQAVEYLRRAIALKPNDKATAARAYVWIGQILMSMPSDSLPVALQAFQAAAAIDSANGDAIRGAGLSLLLMDNCAEALQWLNRGTEVDPDHIQGHTWLAQGYLKCKDIPKGKIEFNKVLELDPTNKQATEGLSSIRKYEQAKQQPGQAKPPGRGTTQPSGTKP